MLIFKDIKLFTYLCSVSDLYVGHNILPYPVHLGIYDKHDSHIPRRSYSVPQHSFSHHSPPSCYSGTGEVLFSEGARIPPPLP